VILVQDIEKKVPKEKIPTNLLMFKLTMSSHIHMGWPSYHSKIAGLTVINSKNPCQNDLEIIDLTS
jgi:hypothetical protein